MKDVIQADRDAAADFYGPHLSRPGEVLVTAHMRAGKIDESPLIQAFAAHRLSASNELVEACREAMPRNICLTNPNIPDDTVLPMDVTMGELRRIATALAKASPPQLHGVGDE